MTVVSVNINISRTTVKIKADDDEIQAWVMQLVSNCRRKPTEDCIIAIIGNSLVSFSL